MEVRDVSEVRVSVQPNISVLLGFGGDARRADEALRTLSAGVQKNCEEGDYEIVAVEGDSPDLLGEVRVRAHGANVRYLRRALASDAWDGARLSLAHTTAPFIGLIFGAIPRLTPRVMEHALLATKVDPDPLIVVPSYRLHATRQDGPWGIAPDASAEPDALSSAPGAVSGYRMFEFASFAPGFQRGFLAPFDEVNCLFVRRESLAAAVEDSASAEMSLLGRLAARPHTQLVVLAGEGAFTTEDDPVMRQQPAPPKLRVPTREPLLLGVVHGNAQRLLFESTDWAGVFHSIVRKRGGVPYPMDP
jgi:hypothetical protein